MARSTGAFLLALCSCSVSCTTATASDLAADRAAIAAASAEVEVAENAGSIERLRNHYAEDVVMMPPNMPSISGADSVATAWEGFLAAFALEVDYVSEEISVSGDLGFDRGTYTQMLTPKTGGPPINERGRYLWVYRRASDGTWKQSRVIWSSSEPAPAATPGA